MMTEQQQMKLAHYMTNCLLRQNGLRPYACDERMSARECTTGMDDRAHTTYTVLYSEILT